MRLVKQTLLNARSHVTSHHHHHHLPTTTLALYINVLMLRASAPSYPTPHIYRRHHNTKMPPVPTPSIDTLLSHFLTTLHLHLRPTWLSHTLSSQRLPTGAALLASLKFRVLASDITESLQAHANLCFPPDIHDTDVTSVALPGPIVVQALAVEDMGVSRADQIERIEIGERGEVMRGREVIRVVPDAEGEEGAAAAGRTTRGKTGPCKVLLEDAGGRRVYAIELKPVEGVKVDMAIGAKMVLRDIKAARGLLLLTPENTTFLGGKIEALNLAWVAGRKQALQAAIDQLRSQG